MVDEKKERVVVAPSTTIREALQAIDATGITIALVVDPERRLIGTVTDGDARRAILRGVDLGEPVKSIMNPTPCTVTPSSDTQAIRRLFFESRLKYIPIVDADGRILDLIQVNDLVAMPLSNPDITDRERDAVLEVLRTNNLSLGPKVIEFEQKVAAYCGRRHAVAVNSGTSGLHLIVKSLGLGPGDEVITTPFSFIASSNCLLYENATPVFVDIEPDTYNVDPERVEAAITPRTRAILAVDVFGQPADYTQLAAIARKHNLRLISDSCESIGSEHAGRRAGSFGDAGVFAFYPNKQITTGEGGIIVTDDEELARLCRSYRNQGRAENGGWLCHERLGYNYRLSDISSALGIAQLERLDEIVAKRQKVADLYTEMLSKESDLRLPTLAAETTRMSWFVYVVRLADEYSQAERDFVMQELARQGIGVNSYFQPIHLQPFYRERFGFKPGDFPITEAISQRTLALPFHNQVSRDSASWVATRLQWALRQAREGRTPASSRPASL